MAHDKSAPVNTSPRYAQHPMAGDYANARTANVLRPESTAPTWLPPNKQHNIYIAPALARSTYVLLNLEDREQM
jgi:hypothetical protein